MDLKNGVLTMYVLEKANQTCFFQREIYPCSTHLVSKSEWWVRTFTQLICISIITLLSAIFCSSFFYFYQWILNHNFLLPTYLNICNKLYSVFVKLEVGLLAEEHTNFLAHPIGSRYKILENFVIKSSNDTSTTWNINTFVS